jgi:hypothetical protein
MPFDFLKELVKHYREQEAWLRESAAAYKSGAHKHFIGDIDDSTIIAADLDHRANNIAAMIIAYERLIAKNANPR